MRSGALINTLSLGKVKFTVTAISQDGLKTSKTLTYSVVAPKVVSAPRYLVSTEDETGRWAFSRLVSVNAPKPCKQYIGHLHCPKRTPPSITLSAPFTDDTTLWQWHLKVAQNDPTARQTIELQVFMPGSKVATYRLTEAWPSKMSVHGLQAGSTQTSVVTVTFRGDSLTRVGSHGPALP